MEKSKFSTKDLCMIGLWTAVIVVMAQISIPLPSGVPVTMQTFAIALAAVVLGAKKGGLATLIYVLLGAIGIPVFAGFSGGFASVVGPTGGFILSFPIIAFIIGLGADHKKSSTPFFIGMLVVSILVNYVMGIIGFCLVTKGSVMTAISACILPFIVPDVAKIAVASMVGLQIKQRLGRVVCN